ncbi:group-specific protein [Salibacterium lacus]|uniref:Group-specific protein n=1 Tax=Salibacterium lacus TaxID=1898109 RepID=A0ABW5T0I0_9BACI
MIQVQIDEAEAKELYLQKLNERMKELEAETAYWDAKELKRQTCMSWNTIQDQFFYHPNFPKYKVGQKWYFPAKETKEFLLWWIRGKG